MRTPLVALVLLVLVAGCEDEQQVERRAETSEAGSSVAGRGCNDDYAGPWTACPEADWVRRIVRSAGYRVVGSTGSALVARGRGESFYIWATGNAARVRRTASEGGYVPVGTVDGVRIYSDAVRRWWLAQGFVLWVESGPRGESAAPGPDELAPLVRASRRITGPG